MRTLAVIETAQRAGLALDEIKVLLSASPGDPAAVERLREVASRKLPEIAALIERTELVRGWLECAARCECPDLDDCPLFDDPPLNAAPPHRPRLPTAPGAEPRAVNPPPLDANSWQRGHSRSQVQVSAAHGAVAPVPSRQRCCPRPGRAQIAPLWMRLRPGARTAAPAHSGGSRAPYPVPPSPSVT